MGLAPLAWRYFAWRRRPWLADYDLYRSGAVADDLRPGCAFRAGVASAIGILSNPAMVGAVLLTFVLQLIVVYFPPAQTFFDTQALSARDLILSLVLATIPFIGFEAQKWWRRRSA